MLQQEYLSRAAQATLFPGIDADCGSAKTLISPVADFDKHQAPGIQHDQINFSGSGAIIAAQMFQAVRLQITARRRFDISTALTAAGQSVLARLAARVISPLRTRAQLSCLFNRPSACSDRAPVLPSMTLVPSRGSTSIISAMRSASAPSA